MLLCSSSTISSIYYGFFVNGPLLNEDFVPAAVVGESSNCPSTGIKYPLKVSKASFSRTASTHTHTQTEEVCCGYS